MSDSVIEIGADPPPACWTRDLPLRASIRLCGQPWWSATKNQANV